MSGIVSVFEAARNVKPGKPLLTTANGALTYGALIERTARLAGLLRKNNISQGDRAIIASSDDIEGASVFLGLLRYGVAPVMLDPRLPALEARALVSASKAKCAFVDPALRAWVDDIPHVFELGKTATKAGMFAKLMKRDKDDMPSFLEGVAPEELPEEVNEGLDAYIMFTSGTTSRPKGVRIGHKALFTHLATLSRQFGLGEDSRILNILPLSHADGLIQGPVSALYNRATLYRPFEFSLNRITDLLDAIYRERITHFIAVPAMLSLINRLGPGEEASLSTGDLRAVISSAAFLNEGLWEGFEKKYGVRVANMYGLTETVTGGLFCGPGDSDRRMGTIGKPIDCEAMIVRGDGSEATDGEPGELLLKGENLMTGYFEDDEATAAALKDGWLHTGDIATRDNDGFFRIAGRKKNLIISGGLNIQPEEVTEALSAHPDVLEAVTFGIDDSVWGELAVSCVALAQGSSVGEADLAAWCRGRLAKYKVPQRVYVLPELPKGRSGKVVAAEAKKMALEAGRSENIKGTGLRERVLNAASESFGTASEELSEYSTPDNVAGWDSLAHLQFVLALEESFNVKLDPADIIRIESIGEAERIVSEKLSR